MRFSVMLLLGGVACVSAIASPAPTAAPDVAIAMAALLRERQIQGQLPGLSGSLGTDGFVLSFLF